MSQIAPQNAPTRSLGSRLILIEALAIDYHDAGRNTAEKPKQLP